MKSIRAVREPIREFVSKRLFELKKSRVELSDFIQKELSYISQLETGKVNFPAEMISEYVEFLELNDRAAEGFRKRVEFANSFRKSKLRDDDAKMLGAALQTFEEILGDETLRQIEELIDQKVSSSKIQFDYSKRRGRVPERVSPERFLEIFRTVYFERSRVSEPDELCKLTKLVEAREANDMGFKVTWHADIPEKFGDVFACIEIGQNLAELHFVDKSYRKAHFGQPFLRHLLAHEFSHFLLGHRETKNLLPDPDREIRSLGGFDNDADEFEAELGATMLLIPWRRMRRGEESAYLAKRFQAEARLVNKIKYFLRNPIVSEGIYEILNQKGGERF